MSCREAARLEPGHYRARKLLGSALYALGDARAARGALADALALRPDYADARCDMGAQGFGFMVLPDTAMTRTAQVCVGACDVPIAMKSPWTQELNMLVC